MTYQQLIILLPCHSLEDFPTQLESDETQGLLANWTALWHPALVASAKAIPAWFRADAPPQDVTDRLIVIPGASQSKLPTGFLQRAEKEAACVVCNELDRRKILDSALERLDPSAKQVDEDFAGDFLALGYCYLQVELLTRQMRYSSNLDEIHFQNQVVAAATASVQGDLQQTGERLLACFDILTQEREHYFPSESFLLDITMLGPTTLGEPLRRQIAEGPPSNLLLTAEVLGLLADKEPETWAALKLALEEGRVGLIGGEFGERRLPLLACETILGQLKAGLARFDTLLGRRPVVFGRQGFGLTPMLPQVLKKLQFEAAVHAVFQAGVIPEGSQAKTRWEGCDGTAVDSLAKPPGDAAKQKTFLNYGVKMGESLDMDHVAAICLAHWPGATCPWYEDLRRIAEYCPALGKFVTVEQYFRQTSLPVHQDRFGVDQYRSVYLKEAVSQDRVDPISSVVRYWRHRAAAEAAQSLDTLAALVSGRVTRNSSPSAGDGRGAASDALLTDIDLQDELDGRGMPDDLIQDAVQRSLDHFAGALPRSGTRPQIGYLVANPHSFVRRIGFEAPELAGLPEIERPIYSASAAGASKHVVVDVPAMGFAWVAAPPSPAKSKKEPQVLADECLLRNEFFEARVDPVTGALRSFHEYQARGNRLSQQLAFRLGELKRPKAGEVWQDADYAALYSIMAADSVKTTIATPTLGEIVARGRLMDRQGTVLATYRQTYRVWRGSRVLHVDIELDPKIECQPDPSNSYFSARFAWSNEVAELYRTVNETRHKTTAKRFESPHYVEIDDADKRTAILTGGLAFHRRQGPRMLDTLLIVHGERCRTFQFGIGLDLKHPMQEALSLLTPDTVLCQAALPPGPNSSGWLFHVDSRNVTATHWEPLVEEGQTAGFRVRLLETGGRAVKAGLSCFRTVRSARRMRFQGEALGDCPITEGKIEVQLAAHEWAEVEARW